MPIILDQITSPTVNALAIITDAYERCNRLSPGETLSADDAAFGLRRLNLMVDEMSASNIFMFQSVLTAVAQSGPIVLGAGDWLTVPPGAEVVSAVADDVPMNPITMAQYNALSQPATIGRPSLYAHDGLDNVFLWPVPNGQTVTLQTRTGVSAFADQATDYIVPKGYASALGAGLAVRIAPAIIGAIPAYLLQAEAKCMRAISRHDPAILNAPTGGCGAARLF